MRNFWALLSLLHDRVSGVFIRVTLHCVTVTGSTGPQTPTFRPLDLSAWNFAPDTVLALFSLSRYTHSRARALSLPLPAGRGLLQGLLQGLQVKQ